MNTHAFEKKLHSLKARFGLQLFVLAAVVCTSWIVTDHANAVYILTGPEDAAIVLNEEEVREGEMSSQLVYLSSGQSGYDMALTAGQEVTVTHDGSTVTAKARSETVAELLERLHITPSPLEMVAVDLDEDSAELTIASELTYYDQVEEPATYETVRVANPSLPKGTEKVVQEGADGVRTSIYEVVWSGGEEISRQFVEELRQSDLSIAPPDGIKSLPNRVSNSSEVTFKNNGILFGRRNFVKPQVICQSPEVTLHTIAWRLQTVNIFLCHSRSTFQIFSSFISSLRRVREVVYFVLIYFCLFSFVLCTRCCNFILHCYRIGA